MSQTRTCSQATWRPGCREDAVSGSGVGGGGRGSSHPHSSQVIAGLLAGDPQSLRKDSDCGPNAAPGTLLRIKFYWNAAPCAHSCTPLWLVSASAELSPCPRDHNLATRGASGVVPLTEEAGGPWISSAGSSPPQSPVLARSHIVSPTSPRRNQGRREARPGDPSFGQREKQSLQVCTIHPETPGERQAPGSLLERARSLGLMGRDPAETHLRGCAGYQVRRVPCEQRQQHLLLSDVPLRTRGCAPKSCADP